jgi:hypothetical protein
MHTYLSNRLLFFSLYFSPRYLNRPKLDEAREFTGMADVSTPPADASP